MGIFPTNNSYKTTDVILRWKYIRQELWKFNLIPIFSTDAYPTLLATMKCFVEFGKNNFYPGLTCPLLCNINTFIKVIQDTIHLLNKLKTRLMDSANCLQIGNFVATINFLRILVNHPNLSKNDHWLSNTDVGAFDSTKDKMNSRATEKICEQRVIDLLKKYIVGSDGTVAYLSVMRCIINAFMEPTTHPIDRLYNAFFALLFIRVWRENIKEKEKDNFITNNTWSCLELNCAFLYKLVLDGKGHLILICNSQPCEEIFRVFRSMSHHQETRINFNMMEALEKINRIEKLRDICYELRNHFELEENNSMKSDTLNKNVPKYENPDIVECHQRITKAREDVMALCDKLGMTKLIECNPEKHFNTSSCNDSEIDDFHIEAHGCSLAPATDIPIEPSMIIEIGEKRILKIKNLYLYDEDSGNFFLIKF